MKYTRQNQQRTVSRKVSNQAGIRSPYDGQFKAVVHKIKSQYNV